MKDKRSYTDRRISEMKKRDEGASIGSKPIKAPAWLTFIVAISALAWSLWDGLYHGDTTIYGIIYVGQPIGYIFHGVVSFLLSVYISASIAKFIRFIHQKISRNSTEE